MNLNEMMGRQNIKSELAFGKKFFIKSLNDKGWIAVNKLLAEKVMPAEQELIEIKLESEQPLIISYFVKKQEFLSKIDDISKETNKRARKMGIKNYNVKMQAEMLKKNMTIYNVLEAILKALKKYGATLFDVEIEVKL